MENTSHWHVLTFSWNKVCFLQGSRELLGSLCIPYVIPVQLESRLKKLNNPSFTIAIDIHNDTLIQSSSSNFSGHTALSY